MTFVTYYTQDKKKEKIDKITVIKSYDSSQILNLYKRIKILWKCLKESNSDVYIHSSGFPGIVPLYCFIHRKKYLYHISSDRNILLKNIGKKTSFFTKIALYLDIRLADIIIAQNKFQKNIVEKKFKKKCFLIKNPITITNEIYNFKTNFRDNKVILWVSTIREVKQPDLFLKLAKILPKYKFIMIGGKDFHELELYSRIEREAKMILNLKFLGFVPYHNIQKYYKESSIFVNTSKMEGFPNTFLEAWINYTPVVSLNIDPDGVICKNRLGLHSKTFKQMVEDIKTLLKTEKLIEEMGINSRIYVEKEHNIRKIVNEYEKVICKLSAGGKQYCTQNLPAI